jgi:hypothetical protein
VDLARVQEAGLSGVADPEVLAWAAAEGRVLFTHDVNTMIGYARERLERGEPMPGLFAVPRSVPIGVVVDEVAVVCGASLEGEWQGQVRFLPL